MDWQPIETAPKDGRGILICAGSGEDRVVGEAEFSSDGAWWWANTVGENWDPIEETWGPPTHWMPLPDPPTD